MSENEEAAVRGLVAASGCVHSPQLIEEMVLTALRLGRDKASVADLKLFSRALKELRYAAKVFQPYNGRRKVAVFGSARLKPETVEYQMAEEMGRRLVERGFMVITGGGDGIMGAAQKGAGRDHSFGLNIRLPFEQRANETIHGDRKLITFNYFFTRKVNFVKETDAFVLFPGGFGTQDEGFECLTLMQTGKAKITPLVFLDTPDGRYWETWEFFIKNDLLRMKLISPSDFHLFKIFHDCEEAIDHITQFYKVFVSYRWVREKMVIRLKRRITPRSVEVLNDQFKNILVSGRIEQTVALPEEAEAADIADLPRLVLTPEKTDFGMLRLLIDSINNSETEA
ncbi:MAG: TIGR00730 family Rossman fold protein [Chthoniobacterales bacterium]|nr:TIGR00730 family Rossman fold protein [Chthoniobacterales bacterium]